MAVDGQSQSYPLGGTQTERDRLLAQAKQYEASANWLLDQITIQPGWTAVEEEHRGHERPARSKNAMRLPQVVGSRGGFQMRKE